MIKTISAQSAKPKMDFYFNPSLNIGYNLGNSIKDSQNKDSYYYQNNIAPYLPNKLSYGILAVGGYHFLPNFAVGGGLKYSYIDPNFHLVYWLVQPRIIIGPGDDAFFIDLTYGSQLNNTAVKDSYYLAVKLGVQTSFSKRLSQEGAFVLERMQLGDNSAFFLGVSYGITVFSNKNYTKEGLD
ncbi:hypothetical protein ASG01_10800 [Chryseobacterium sp. Leaf180]|uniref:hypothetical protein n=1 Tax=Chryseobacterium sp. Leaf180 TaxID=1736289 RepID=UPI0006F2CD49|nr:hypothetical protein [Chryseobacterium sp. Leaf180]KQR92409.1 hypothetical protein ASG01_10800 [Chryseobacterium sp. Leaf180]